MRWLGFAARTSLMLSGAALWQWTDTRGWQLALVSLILCWVGCVAGEIERRILKGTWNQVTSPLTGENRGSQEDN